MKTAILLTLLSGCIEIPGGDFAGAPHEAPCDEYDALIDAGEITPIDLSILVESPFVSYGGVSHPAPGGAVVERAMWSNGSLGAIGRIVITDRIVSEPWCRWYAALEMP